jgi:hypothetical protein
MFRTLVAFAIFLFSYGNALAAEFRIATWNIAWLNAADDSGTVGREAADYDRLAEYATRLDADIVALQEVDGPATAKRVFPESEYEFRFSERNSVQRVGFAIRSSGRRGLLRACSGQGTCVGREEPGDWTFCGTARRGRWR